MIKPLEYQIPAIEKHVHALKRYGSTLDASDTGTGKTYVSLFVAKALGYKPTVICPKAVIESWKSAAVGVGHALMEIKNYEKAIRHPMAPPEMLIFDEVHRCSGLDTKNSKLLMRAKQHRIPTLMLSATPAESPLKMKAIGYSLDLFHDPRRFWPWMLKHGVRNTPVGWKPGKPEHMLKIWREIEHRLVRIRKTEVEGFPTVQTYMRELESVKITPKRDDYIAIREAVEFGKVPQILDLMADREGSQIVFCSFRQTFHALAEKLKNPALIYGGQDEAERTEGLTEFQANKRKFAVVMIQAGGAGISLHDTHGDSPRTSYITLPDSAVNFRQALGRINRAGQKSFAENIILHTHGSFESRIAARLERKLTSIDFLNDGDLDCPELKLEHPIKKEETHV